MALIFNNNKKEQPRTECLWDSCWYAGVDDDSIEISFEHYDDETIGVKNCTKEEENDEFDDERVIDDDDNNNDDDDQCNSNYGSIRTATKNHNNNDSYLDNDAGATTTSAKDHEVSDEITI